MIKKLQRLFRYIFLPISQNKNNCHFISSRIKIEKKIIGVYHIYCVNNWRELFNSQISSLKKSELFDITKKLYVSIISNNIEDIEYIKNTIGDKCEVINKNIKDNRYEFIALDFIKKISGQCDNIYIYYFHTKGVSLTKEKFLNQHKYGISFEKIKRNSDLWRKMMEYWIFEKHNLAINVLDSGMYTYGVFFYESPNYNFYAGNFWWTKSEYIKKLPEFNSENIKNRYNAETWLLSLKLFDRYYCAFDCIAELYSVPIYKSLYTKFSLFDYIKFLFYHYKDCFYRKIYLKLK